MLPLQLIDSFLLDYHMGHVMLLLFAVTTAGALPLKSQRLVAVNLTLFGALFAMAPFGLMTAAYVLFGVALLVIGPLLYATAG